MDKAQIALESLRSVVSDRYESVALIGRWRGNDVFADSTPPDRQQFMVGAPGLVLVNDRGDARFPLIEEFTSSDFPEWRDED